MKKVLSVLSLIAILSVTTPVFAAPPGPHHGGGSHGMHKPHSGGPHPGMHRPPHRHHHAHGGLTIHAGYPRHHHWGSYGLSYWNSFGCNYRLGYCGDYYSPYYSPYIVPGTSFSIRF